MIIVVQLKCQTADIADDCPSKKLNGHSLEIVEKCCYLGNTIGDNRGVVDCVITWIRNEWH